MMTSRLFNARTALLALALVIGIATTYTVFAASTEGEYDRLDGTGESGKKVDVIEWEGNLEIHVYPENSVAGLGAKLDDRDAGKKVMVIAYRFKNDPNVLTRRAILGVPFNKNIKGFKDPTAKGYDKLAFSNKNLPAPWVPYKLDPEPKLWYPEGDERNENDPALEKQNVKPLTEQQPEKQQPRQPATQSKQTEPKQPEPKQDDQDEPTIQHFSW